uniref:MYND-type domain-containing protein n=1 Tax=Mycena chlorophos TaxID=658473 RepID=A0ABQ0LYC6_MYCCL|nr:predicted protein [Mycena chlorophos]
MLPAEQQSGAEKDYNEISYGIHGASLFLFNNCQDLLRDDGPHLQAVLDGVGGWEHLAELFVRHTHQSIPVSGVTATAWHSERVACPLIFLKTGRPALFFDALGRWGMIAALTKAALRLPGMRDDKVARQTDITLYLRLLIENHPRSDLRLIEGLRAGLIEAMSQAAPVARETVRSFLVKVIIQHCVYRSVVHALQHALRHPSIKTRTDLFEDLGLSREWKQCKNTILASALSVKEYEEGNANWTSGRGCDNSDCRSSSSDVQLRRCGGCYYTRYCSRSCQKADWHSTHRSECRFVRYQLQRNRALFTPGDRGFFDAHVFHAFRDPESNEVAWRSSLKQPGRCFPVDTGVMEREAKDGSDVERYTPWAETKPAARMYAELLARRGVRLGGSARAQIGCLGFVQGTAFRKHYVLVRIPEVVESADKEASGSKSEAKSSGAEDETVDAEEDV